MRVSMASKLVVPSVIKNVASVLALLAKVTIPAALLPMVTAPVDVPVLMFVAKLLLAFKFSVPPANPRLVATVQVEAPAWDKFNAPALVTANVPLVAVLMVKSAEVTVHTEAAAEVMFVAPAEVRAIVPLVSVARVRVWLVLLIANAPPE